MSPVPDCPGIGIPGDPELLAAGWVRRHVVDTERALEAIALYQELGFEVRAETLNPDAIGPGCGGCSPVLCSGYLLIYTRRTAQRCPGGAG